MQPHPFAAAPVPNPADERDLGRVALVHTSWAVFLGCSVVYYLAGPFFRLFARDGAIDWGGTIVGGAFVAFILGLMVVLIVAHLWAASAVRQKKRRAHATFMSGFMCLSVPVGTILGLYSLSILNRPSVRALFGK
jgi:hypothetical protein